VTSPATFDEAIAYANELGWYIYQLCQGNGHETGWTCCLRQDSGGYRRQISRGNGCDPVDAIMAAISEAPELEAEVKTYSGIATPPTEEKALDIFALIGASKPNLRITRTRS
jgi:hypothetical protein